MKNKGGAYFCDEEIPVIGFEGAEWTPQSMIMCILVSKLGGTAIISYDDIKNVRSLIMTSTKEGIRITGSLKESNNGE